MSKTVEVKYLVTGETIYIEIDINKKVKDLKEKIENLFKIKILNKLMIQHKNKKNPTNLSDENQTIQEAHIHNNDVIRIGKEY